MTLDRGRLAETLVPVEIVEVSLRPGGAQLINVGVYPWGKFDGSDLANLRGSIEDTLADAMDGKTLSHSDRLRIAVVVEHYTVASSNDEIAALAAVQWCGVLSSRKTLLRDVFYAAYSDGDMTTLGIVKNTANEAIVRRITENSLHLAAEPSPVDFEPLVTEHTYNSFAQAVAVVPRSLQPSGIFISNPTPVYLEGGDAVEIPWEMPAISAGSACEALR